MSLIKLLGIAYTVWKVAAKRLGPVGGPVVAAVATVVYVYLDPWFTENYLEVTRIIE